MGEGQVTVDGAPKLKPFMVVATQSPVEFEAFPLPSPTRQFFLVLQLGYPTAEEEKSLESAAETSISAQHRHQPRNVAQLGGCSQVMKNRP